MIAKRDMSWLVQALRWWGRQTNEGSIPPRHASILLDVKAMYYDEYNGTYDLTSKGKRLVRTYKEE